ncbi:hypothetical protein [Deminuibacter soli]|uniref:Uncharacterized protein n=1 Tax=Deminuibacter soli TaxID=2291815 RepID=A0A3E1NCU5_9BACT|nr:hypothetical protein [Deminuibacter soli]RFM25825.1 hypothetical protein DXN05_22970 [Deminuibacter soli]
MERFILEKIVWTDDDFEKMGWHDNTVHAISFGSNYEFLLDLDYIFEWSSAKGENVFYEFWVSPCTLIFENVSDLNFNITITEPFLLEIADVKRSDPKRPLNADYIKREIEYQWLIETNQGDITFRSVGYKQFVRREPLLIDSQQISLSKRGGISFDRQ